MANHAFQVETLLLPDEPRVLLVTDKPMGCTDISHMLIRQGYEVFRTDCGKDTLAVIAKEKPDLVLLDIVSGEFNGLECLLAIRSEHSRDDLPVILLAEEMGHEVAVALRCGANDYLTRPLSPELQLARMDTLIRFRKLQSALRQSEQRLEEMAINQGKVHDSLTGLPNRLLFKERLEVSLQRERGEVKDYFVVLFLDLDKFKIINDSLGHHAGDQLLVHVAKRLISCLRVEDTILQFSSINTVARHGGDEFTILLDRVNCLSDAEKIAERIITSVSEPYDLNGHEVCIGVSIGIAMGRDATKSADDLLREADTAMYQAKSEGRGQHRLFDPEMQQRASSRLRLEKDLRHAVKAQEFYLQYQPILDLSSGHVEGFEALVRWNHPCNENIGPQQFVPVAEELGLIGTIGHWVFNEACRQASEWNRCYPEISQLTLNINISIHELLQTRFQENIQTAIRGTGVRPSTIKVELTESAFMKDPELIGPLLQDLRLMGIKIGIDDFGTGYSSLAYLHRLPLDVLKIDRSFVNSMCKCQESLEIVRTILSLGRSLKLDVVAEGIENEEQRNILLELGCTHGQGYLFYRPMSAEDASRILHSQQQGYRQLHPNLTPKQEEARYFLEDDLIRVPQEQLLCDFREMQGVIGG